MSSIDKMAIKGIRSFDNHQNETIQFLSPLTLIVGHNGSGKTTIIECLKYATTGQMPPNSRGGAFIHDPDMCGEKEVLAQVKLSFNNTNREKLICTRSLQLTLKKSRSQKTLDGTLTIMRNGERSTISTRCADLDQQMPISLGVSKAILEYVIFCHQEESTWPLSEPSVLKKHFDEIFEALKYTKALEQIKAVRKEQLITVRVDNVELDHLRINKERASKLQAESDQLLEKIASLRTFIKSLDEQMVEAVNEQNDLFRSGEEFERIIAELDKYRHERKIMKETHQDLLRNIIEYKESNEELQDMQNNFASTMARQREVVDELKEQIQQARQELADARDNLNSGMSEEGQLKAQAEQYEKHVTKRMELIRLISRNHNIRGFDMSLDEMQVDNFKEKLGRLSSTYTQRLERLKETGRKQETDTNSELQALLVQHAEFESLVNSARTQIKANEKKVAELQIDLDRDARNVTDFGNVQKELRQVEEKILKVRSDFDRGDWDAQLKRNNATLRDIEDRIDIVNNEINTGNRQSDTRAKLGLLKAEIERKKDNLQSTILSIEEQFNAVTRKNLESANLVDDIRIARTMNDSAIADAKSSCDNASKEVSQIEAQISIHREDLKSKKRQGSQLKEQVEEVFEDPETADEELSNIEKELEVAQSNYYQAQYAVKFYERAVLFAQDKDCCQLCNQEFHTNFTLEDFLSLIDQKKAMVPKHLAKAQEAIDICQSDLNNAKAIQPARTALEALQHEIPRLDDQLKVEQVALKDAVEVWEHANAQLQEQEMIASTINNLDRTSTDILRINRELSDLRKQVGNLEAELQTSGSKRSIDEMQAELVSLQEDSRKIKRASSQLQDERDSIKANIQLLDGQRRDLQLSQSELQSRSRERDGISARMQEGRDNITRFLRDAETAERRDQENRPKIENLRSELEQLRTKNDESESNAQRELSKLISAQNSLTTVESDIDAYLQSGGPTALKTARLSIEKLKVKVEEYEKQIETRMQDIRDVEAKISDLQNTERNINDNLRLRKVKADIDRVHLEIRALESRNAERDREQYVIDTKRLKDRYSTLITERASLLGEITQMDNQLREKRRELEGEYKNADEDYRTKLISVRTMEKANEDLDKYGKALDNAIMKYHSLKMEEINKIIDELWKSTYCGTDVDSISIRSEGESQATNRSYNYRVCMVKGDAELDMRGRCSAGQKVLAAIIIRLALAECFGVNCGILALDEPTTNLDRENIESLAKSLANIISVRRSQRNFQLIVITHDEEFLRMMGCSDYCDHYYRVSRNEHQKSEITRQRVSTVL